MGQEQTDHTLQATALVHEVYARLAGAAGRPAMFANAAHFYAAAAEAMRRILIDHARARDSDKRGGRRVKFNLSSVLDLAAAPESDDILALDEALLRLEQETPEAAAVVRMRFYAGLSVDETAEALGVAPRTVDRDWAYARAWLFRELRPGEKDTTATP
jgi:RNA polymerase sigma factor (TIGR02999 family)